ncbi:MAG: hypothetical protein WBW04_21765 [Nitrolancea sp.]
MTQRSVVPFRSSQSGLSPQSSQLSPRIQGSLDHYGDAAFAVEEITQTTIDSMARMQIYAAYQAVGVINQVAHAASSIEQISAAQREELQRQADNFLRRTGMILDDTFDEIDYMRVRAIRGLTPPPSRIDRLVDAVAFYRAQQRGW